MYKRQTNNANSAEDLPKVCRHGYIVKVVNSGEDQDDFYLKFRVNNIAADNSVTATYARSGTTITVTSNAHGLSNGDTIITDFTSGAGTDGWYTVANVTTNTFTVTDSASGTISAGTAMTYTPNRFGEGVWEECPAPDLEIEIDKDTMPVRLIRELPGNTYPNGRFVCQSIDYTKRDVGDDNTNPVPSFIGSPLQKMLFFRNRLVVLSQNNVITSKTNDFFNFFSTSAMTETSSDPIDLQASSTFPTTIFDGIEVNAGLLLFSSNQQFMLTTDSDALTPTTAKVNYLSSYNFNPKTVPFSMGVTSGFINSTGKNSRIFEMADIKREGEPTVLEQSKLVSKKLPINLTKPTTSRENSLLILGAEDYPEVWGFRYYSNGEKRVQSAWFRWSLSGNLLHHVILDDVYYLIIQSGSDVLLESIDVKKQDDTKVIGTENYPIHLDRHTEISALSSSSYNASTKKTTFPRPTGFASTAPLAIYNHNSGNEIGRYALTTANGSNLEVDGDWTGTTFMLGYLYDFLVEIPVSYTHLTLPTKA